jgi:hypothetical protein
MHYLSSLAEKIHPVNNSVLDWMDAIPNRFYRRETQKKPEVFCSAKLSSHHDWRSRSWTADRRTCYHVAFYYAEFSFSSPRLFLMYLAQYPPSGKFS